MSANISKILFLFFLGLFAFDHVWSQEQSPLTKNPNLLYDVGLQKTATSEVKKVIQGFLQAVRDHDYSKAYFAFTTHSFRSVTPSQTFQQFILNNPVLSRNQAVDFSEPSFQNNMVVIKTTMTSVDNIKNVVEFAFIQEGGFWKILGMKVFPAK